MHILCNLQLINKTKKAWGKDYGKSCGLGLRFYRMLNSAVSHDRAGTELTGMWDFSVLYFPCLWRVPGFPTVVLQPGQTSISSSFLSISLFSCSLLPFPFSPFSFSSLFPPSLSPLSLPPLPCLFLHISLRVSWTCQVSLVVLARRTKS